MQTRNIISVPTVYCSKVIYRRNEMSKKKNTEAKVKSKKTNKKPTRTARGINKSLITAAAEAEAKMSEEQCLIWRSNDVSLRIRTAIAQWSQVSSSVITSSKKLKELAPPADGPWSNSQQNNLIAITNNQNPPIFHSIIPEDDQCEMKPLSSLISGDTTVLDWEDVVWRNQDPRTFCKSEFGI